MKILWKHHFASVGRVTSQRCCRAVMQTLSGFRLIHDGSDATKNARERIETV